MRENAEWWDEPILETHVVLSGVEQEVARHVTLWGHQTHDFRSEMFADDANTYAWSAGDWKTRNSHRVKADQLSWSGILLEEVFEALAEDDLDNQITELTQVAAVCVSAILDIRRKRDAE